jgi:hypothetical protein
MLKASPSYLYLFPGLKQVQYWEVLVPKGIPRFMISCIVNHKPAKWSATITAVPAHNRTASNAKENLNALCSN